MTDAPERIYLPTGKSQPTERLVMPQKRKVKKFVGYAEERSVLKWEGRRDKVTGGLLSPDWAISHKKVTHDDYKITITVTSQRLK